MHKENIENNSVIYLVVGNKHGAIGRRVRSILSLRDSIGSMVLVSRGKDFIDKDNIIIKPWPNPTAIFKHLRLNLLKCYLDRYLYFPSPIILYVERMRRVLERRIENDVANGKRVVVITSVPPHAVCMAMLKIKKKFPKVKWIVDWRDLWSYDDNYRQRIPHLYEKKLLGLEMDILNTCDMNVTTNLYAKRVLEEHYGIDKRRILSISHSFDKKDYDHFAKDTSPVVPDFKNKAIKIGFLGTLMKPPKVPGERLIEAVRSVRKSGINVELFHYGSLPDSITGRQEELGKEGIFFLGKFPYSEGLRKLSECDFLILILGDLPNCKVVMHLKVTDYLLVNKPIIAIVSRPSMVAHLIEETRSGFVIPADSNWDQELARLLNIIIENKVMPVRDEKKIMEYSWEHVSRQWIALINSV